MIFIIGDSILRRLDIYSSVGWPKFLFDKNTTFLVFLSNKNLFGSLKYVFKSKLLPIT